MTENSEVGFQPRKRLFIGLLTGACALVLVLAFLLWWIPSVGLTSIHPLLPILFGTLLFVLALVIVVGLALLILTLLTGRDLFFSDRLRGIVVRYLFPAIIGLGRLLGIHRDTLQQSFIALNNQLVRAKKLRVSSDRTLILLPHCIQLFDCAIKITGDVTFKPGKEGLKGLPIKITKADLKSEKFTGTHTFDTKLGRLKESKQEMTVKGTFTISAGGQEIEAGIIQKSTTTLTVTDRNPVTD